MIKTSKIKQVIALSEIENFSSLNAIFGFQLQETNLNKLHSILKENLKENNFEGLHSILKENLTMPEVK